MLRRVALSLALSGLFAGPLSGQVQVGLSGYAGGFLPIGDLFDEVPLAGRRIANLGQEPGLLVGGRVTFRISRLAIDLEGGHAFSNIDLPDTIVALGLDDNGSVFLSSLNVTYTVFQAPFSPLSIHVAGGGGFVNRGGELLDFFAGTTDVAVTLGVGFRFGLGRLTHLRFDVRDYISSFAPTRRRDEDFGSQLQNDVIATIGLEFAFTPVR